MIATRKGARPAASTERLRLAMAAVAPPDHPTDRRGDAQAIDLGRLRVLAERVVRFDEWDMLGPMRGIWSRKLRPLYASGEPAIDDVVFAARWLRDEIPINHGLRRAVAAALYRSARAAAAGEATLLAEELDALSAALEALKHPPSIEPGTRVEVAPYHEHEPVSYRGVVVRGAGAEPRLARVLITQEPPTDNAVLACLGQTLEIDVGDLRVAAP